MKSQNYQKILEDFCINCAGKRKTCEMKAFASNNPIHVLKYKIVVLIYI